MTKEEILGLPFYPHECGSMIECVTKQDALKAMEEYTTAKDAEIERLEAELENVRLYFSLTEIEFDNLKINNNDKYL